jgi:hypothetical protein
MNNQIFVEPISITIEYQIARDNATMKAMKNNKWTTNNDQTKKFIKQNKIKELCNNLKKTNYSLFQEILIIIDDINNEKMKNFII